MAETGLSGGRVTVNERPSQVKSLGVPELPVTSPSQLSGPEQVPGKLHVLRAFAPTLNQPGSDDLTVRVR